MMTVRERRDLLRALVAELSAENRRCECPAQLGGRPNDCSYCPKREERTVAAQAEINAVAHRLFGSDRHGEAVLAGEVSDVS
jgi:hypothetical protein